MLDQDTIERIESCLSNRGSVGLSAIDGNLAVTYHWLNKPVYDVTLPFPVMMSGSDACDLEISSRRECATTRVAELRLPAGYWLSGITGFIDQNYWRELRITP